MVRYFILDYTIILLLSTVKNNIQNIKICLDKPNMMMTT